MTKTIQKETPAGTKTITLDYETKTADIGFGPRLVFYGQVKGFTGAYFTEPNIVPGKRIFITLPEAPPDFVQAVKDPRIEEMKKMSPAGKMDYSGLGAGFRDDEMEEGTRQALENTGLGNPFIPYRQPNWRVAHRDS